MEKSVALEKFGKKSDSVWAVIYLAWVPAQVLVGSESLVSPQGWGTGPHHPGQFPPLSPSEWVVVLTDGGGLVSLPDKCCGPQPYLLLIVIMHTGRVAHPTDCTPSWRLCLPQCLWLGSV